MTKRLACGAVLALLAISCSAPLYDRAEIRKGFSASVGAGLGTGLWIGGWSSCFFNGPQLEHAMALVGTGKVSYGFSNSFELFGQGALVWADSRLIPFGPWASPDRQTSGNGMVDLGVKMRAGRNGALRMSLGYPSLVGLAYIHDFSDVVSGSTGLSLRGLEIGASLHPRLTSNFVSHIALGVTPLPWALWYHESYSFPPPVSLGVGIEMTPRR